ncbi:MAG: ScyD/ScyE family protein, partial [Thermomicrobiales bacterium]
MTTRRTVLKGTLLAGAAAAPAVSGLGRVLAQDASPVASPVAAGPEPTVLASGLMSPRYLAVGADGSVYVTEAGIGGDEELMAPAEGSSEGTPEAMTGTPESMTAFATRGPSGQVTKIAPDGTVSVVASGITSYLIGGFEATGPAGIAVADGTIYVSVGGPGPATGTVPASDHDNRVIAIDEATGEITVLADIGAYEIANNPDPNAVDSNLYGLAQGADGLLYVADAGGNTVYSVDPTTGELAVVAVIPGIELPEEMQQPGGNPARGGAQELDPVPTGVAIGGNGDVFVSLLSGGP